MQTYLSLFPLKSSDKNLNLSLEFFQKYEKNFKNVKNPTKWIIFEFFLPWFCWPMAGNPPDQLKRRRGWYSKFCLSPGPLCQRLKPYKIIKRRKTKLKRITKVIMKIIPEFIPFSSSEKKIFVFFKKLIINLWTLKPRNFSGRRKCCSCCHI